MRSQSMIRGLVLIAVALCFGIPAMSYRIGNFAQAGPGLFPLLVSGIVGAIGLLMVVRSRLEGGPSIAFGWRNLAIVLVSLAGFVEIAEHLHAIAAIVYLVFVSTLAGSDYSVRRNLQICAVLIAIAFALRSFLGLSLVLL